MAIIDAPAALAWAQADLVARDTVAETRSVYSGAEGQRRDFGGEWWELTVTTPSLSWDDAADLAAWADRLRDDDATARLGVLSRVAPRRGTTTALVLAASGAAVAGVRSIAVTGLGAGATLGAGTLLSIASRLHRVRQTVTADGAGAATLSLFPRLRASVGDGAVIEITTGVRGLWRLQSRPALGWNVSQLGARAQAMSFAFVEALS